MSPKSTAGLFSLRASGTFGGHRRRPRFVPPLEIGVETMYELLATQLLAAPASVITFDNLDTNYRAFLVFIAGLKSAITGDLNVRLNADAAANYNRIRQVDWDTGVALAQNRARGSGETAFTSGENLRVSRPFQATLRVSKPLSTQRAHLSLDWTQLREVAAESNMRGWSHGQWANITALISRIDIRTNAGSFDTGTIAWLGGLKVP